MTSLHVPIFHLRRLPPLFCFCLGALLAVILTWFVLQSRSSQQTDRLTTDYADALSVVAAEDAVNAVLNHDLVGLHAILQSLVVHPRVALATVHDVEGKLLVQAGERSFSRTYMTRSATIALHDSIAGQLTVFVRTGFSGDEAVLWIFYGIIFLLCFLACLSLYESKDHAWYLKKVPFLRRVSSEDDSNAAAAEPDSTEQVEEDQTAMSVEFAQCDLILAISNLQRLQQQISKAKLQNLHTAFRTHLDQVLMLYGGVLVNDDAMLDDGLFCIRFSSLDGLAEASFRAACSGWIMRALSEQETLCLTLVATVVATECDIKLNLKAPGLFFDADIMCDKLRNKLVVEQEESMSEREKVVDFEPSVRALLEKQLAQLSSKPMLSKSEPS